MLKTLLVLALCMINAANAAGYIDDELCGEICDLRYGGIWVSTSQEGTSTYYSVHHYSNNKIVLIAMLPDATWLAFEHWYPPDVIIPTGRPWPPLFKLYSTTRSEDGGWIEISIHFTSEAAARITFGSPEVAIELVKYEP